MDYNPDDTYIMSIDEFAEFIKSGKYAYSYSTVDKWEPIFGNMVRQYHDYIVFHIILVENLKEQMRIPLYRGDITQC